MENSESDGNTRSPDLPLEKPIAGQEATVRTGHGTTDWFQIGKGVRQGCILSHGSAGDYQKDEQAGIARLSCRLSSR